MLPLMRRFLLLTGMAALGADAQLNKDIEIAIDRYEQNACSAAKEQARKNYVVEEMTQCTCEMTDEREWQCFVRFTYTAKIAGQESGK